MSDANFVLNNQLLSSLTTSTYQHLLPYLEEVSLSAGQIVHHSNKCVREVYFPQTAIFVRMITMSDRYTVETCSIGNEGVVGLPAILGSNLLNTSSVVQVSGMALKIPLEAIEREFDKGGDLHTKLLLYTQAQIVYISQVAACNSLHSIEQRFARFLLLTSNRIQQETIPLTQKSISLMLGVRRASITETAISLQQRQVIRYSRGRIAILNHSLLEAIACECCSKIDSEYRRLLD